MSIINNPHVRQNPNPWVLKSDPKPIDPNGGIEPPPPPPPGKTIIGNEVGFFDEPPVLKDK